MQWNRSNTIGLAKPSCRSCQGSGLRTVYKRREVPCHCVFRAVFRVCYHRFEECIAEGEHASTVSLELCHGVEGRRRYCRKREEYMADFCLVSRRLLEDSDYRIFRFHFLLAADWKLCCRQFRIDRGCFYHTIYRIQDKLGRAFAELEPYPLYPVDEYFGGTIRKRPRLCSSAEPPAPSAIPLPLSA